MATKSLHKVSLLLLGAFMLAAASGVQAASCDLNQNFGQIERIYPQFNPGCCGPGTFFRLTGGRTGAEPGTLPSRELSGTFCKVI